MVWPDSSFLAEIADQGEGHAEGYDVLEKKQAQETHVPHVPYALDGNNCVWGGYDHSTGCKEHDHCDEPADDTGFRFYIAYDHQYGGRNLRKTD